jgi:hypothetical protein
LVVHCETSGTTNVLPAPVIDPVCLAVDTPAKLAANPSTTRTAAVVRFLFTCSLSSR